MLFKFWGVWCCSTPSGPGCVSSSLCLTSPWYTAPLGDIIALLSLHYLSKCCVALSRQTSIYFIIDLKYGVAVKPKTVCTVLLLSERYGSERKSRERKRERREKREENIHSYCDISDTIFKFMFSIYFCHICELNFVIYMMNIYNLVVFSVVIGYSLCGRTALNILFIRELLLRQWQNSIIRQIYSL